MAASVVPITDSTEPPAANVVEALGRVMRDLPAIGKDQQAAPQQGGYAYRGIEQITRAAQPLLARHGVIFAPMVTEWRPTREITVNGKPWTDESMIVSYRVYGPGGPQDYIEVATPAIGRDNSDKGANKCMTQAFKYALLQVLCIADAKDDGDQVSYEADHYDDQPAQRLARIPTPLVDVAKRDRIRDLIAGSEDPDAVKAGWRDVPLPALAKLTVDLLPTALDYLASVGLYDPDDAAAAMPAQTALVGCPHCGAAISAENMVVTWPDPTSEEDPPPMVAGCAQCAPM